MFELKTVGPKYSWFKSIKTVQKYLGANKLLDNLGKCFQQSPVYEKEKLSKLSNSKFSKLIICDWSIRVASHTSRYLPTMKENGNFWERGR